MNDPSYELNDASDVVIIKDGGIVCATFPKTEVGEAALEVFISGIIMNGHDLWHENEARYLVQTGVAAHG